MDVNKVITKFTLLRYWFFFLFLFLGIFFIYGTIKRWLTNNIFDSGSAAALVMASLCLAFFFWAASKSKLVTKKLYLNRAEINYYFPLWPIKVCIPVTEYRNILLFKVKKGLENESPPLNMGVYFSVALNHPVLKNNVTLLNTYNYKKALECANKYASLFNLKIEDESQLNYYR